MSPGSGLTGSEIPALIGPVIVFLLGFVLLSNTLSRRKASEALKSLETTLGGSRKSVKVTELGAAKFHFRAIPLAGDQRGG